MKLAVVSTIVLAIALVTASAFAQAGRYPAFPPNPGHVMPGTQARALHTPQAPDLTQASFRWLEIDPQGQGHCYTDAHGLNDERQVVVLWTDDCNLYTTHASLWDDGKWTSLDFVDTNCPDVATTFESLDNRGIAFGTYWSTLCNYEPAAGINVRTGKWFVFPEVPDLGFNQGISMSNTGLATGAASDTIAFITNKHWIWNGKEYFFPTFPADWDTSGFWAGPLFVNDWGEIAGQYVDIPSGRMRGYLQSRGKVTTFDAPGNPSGGTYVNGMTNTGNLLLIGGYDQTSPYYPWQSFSLKGSVFTALPNVPFPGATATFVFGLNDRGDISGRWVDSSGLDHAFVAFRK
jgi:hypothetical protein